MRCFINGARGFQCSHIMLPESDRVNSIVDAAVAGAGQCRRILST
jgi:hypothetical protein